MEKVKVEEAVGMVLAHDLTKVISKEYKGTCFKKGHIIQQEDIEVLKDIGKSHIYILALSQNDLHEEEAAQRIAKAGAGDGIYLTVPSEGKVLMKAQKKGILKINIQALEQINDIDMIILSTLHQYTVVEKDQIVAGTKVIPLVIEKQKIEQVEKICSHYGNVLEVSPMFPLKVGIVVTGSEVYYGRIQDRFAPVLQQKIVQLGGICIDTTFAPDDQKYIEGCITELIQKGAEMIMLSGGMAVDADDVTPLAIKETATEVISYGSPILPGAMLMVAYHHDIPIIGVPACGMFSKTTALDVYLPRMFAKEKLDKSDIVSLAHGGLCLGCDACRYPVCPLGK